MIGLIKKDIYLILKNLSAVYLLAFLIVIIPATQNLEMLFPMLSFLLAMILSTQIAATMALDEKSNWKKMVMPKWQANISYHYCWELFRRVLCFSSEYCLLMDYPI